MVGGSESSASESAHSESGGRVFGGRFEPRAQVATGSTSWRFRAIDREHRLPVGLEVFFPDDGTCSPFRKLKAAARVDHRNVARTLAAGRDNDSWFLVTEWVDGRPLDQLIAEGARPSDERLTDLAADLIDGIAAAHRAGMVHGDLTADRVVVTADGRLKITGFGLGGAVDGTASPPATTDLRAVGRLVHEARGEAALPPALEDVVERLLDDGFSSAREAREAVHALLPDRSPDREQSAAQPRPGWVKVVAALLILVIVGGVGLFAAGRLGLRDTARPVTRVPDVVGRTQDEATGLLDEARLGANIQTEASTEVARGQVLSQSPQAGTSLREGDDVTVVVSTGAAGP